MLYVRLWLEEYAQIFMAAVSNPSSVLLKENHEIRSKEWCKCMLDSSGKSQIAYVYVSDGSGSVVLIIHDTKSECRYEQWSYCTYKYRLLI